MPTYLETFAASTISLRLRAGITQDVLAIKAGISQSTIDKIEQVKTNPTLSTMEAVAKALGRSLPEMLTPSKPSEPPRGETVLGWLLRKIFR